MLKEKLESLARAIHMKNNERWVVIVIASTLILLASFIVLLWRVGLFDFTGPEASTKIVAAALALVGGLISSFVTIVGILLKHSMDKQAEERLKIESERNANLREEAEARLRLESERNANLREEAEKRLKVETAIQAVQLLSSSSGQDVPMTQRAGVIYTLENLGMIELAITLATQMSKNNSIDVETVDWLIDRALVSGNEIASEEAASLLRKNACTTFILEGGTARFPTCLINWHPGIPLKVRVNGLYMSIEQMLSKPLSWWEEGYFSFFILPLCLVWQKEEDKTLKDCAGICLEKILDIGGIITDTEIYGPDDKPINIKEIQEQVAGLNTKVHKTYGKFAELPKRIEDWGKLGTNMIKKTSKRKEVKN